LNLLKGKVRKGDQRFIFFAKLVEECGLMDELMDKIRENSSCECFSLAYFG